VSTTNYFAKHQTKRSNSFKHSKQCSQMDIFRPIHDRKSPYQTNEINFMPALQPIANQMKVTAHSVQESHSAAMNALDDGSDSTKIYILTLTVIYRECQTIAITFLATRR